MRPAGTRLRERSRGRAAYFQSRSFRAHFFSCTVSVGLRERVRLPCADQFRPSGARPLGGAKSLTGSVPAGNPHEMRNRNNPMRRKPLGAAARKAPAPERRNCPSGNGAPSGCAFQARSVCGMLPKRALRVAHGVTFVSPLRGLGAKAFLPSIPRPCGEATWLHASLTSRFRKSLKRKFP